MAFIYSKKNDGLHIEAIPQNVPLSCGNLIRVESHLGEERRGGHFNWHFTGQEVAPGSGEYHKAL